MCGTLLSFNETSQATCELKVMRPKPTVVLLMMPTASLDLNVIHLILTGFRKPQLLLSSHHFMTESSLSQ